MRKKIYLIISVFVLLSIGLIISQSFTFKFNENVNFRFRCLIENDTNYCPSTTILTISVEYPNGSSALDNQSLTHNPTFYNVTLKTDALGIYPAIISSPTDNGTVTEFQYEVTSSGSLLSTGKGIIYVITFFGLLFLFSILIFSFFNVPTEVKRDDEGFMLGINYWKYVKWGLGLFSYLTLLWTVNILVAISNNFLPLGVATVFFRMIYFFLLIAILPLAPIVFYIFIFNIVRDKEIRAALERGIKIR